MMYQPMCASSAAKLTFPLRFLKNSIVSWLSISGIVQSDTSLYPNTLLPKRWGFKHPKTSSQEVR